MFANPAPLVMGVAIVAATAFVTSWRIGWLGILAGPAIGIVYEILLWVLESGAVGDLWRFMLDGVVWGILIGLLPGLLGSALASRRTKPDG